MIRCEIRSTRLAKDYRHQSVQPEIVGTSEPIETFFTANKTRQGQFVLKYRLACGTPTFEYKTKRGNDRGKMINDQNFIDEIKTKRRDCITVIDFLSTLLSITLLFRPFSQN